MTFTKRHRISTLAIAVAIALAAPLAWGQGKGSGGGNKPPGGETAVNNLSYPALEINGAGPAATYYFTPSANPVLGTDFSYACLAPETIGESSYDYTSCVDTATGIYYTLDECKIAKPLCLSADFYRMFWQKTATNDWTADALAVGTLSGPQPASHVDWSDSLESQIWWDTAAIRVETTPYATLSEKLTGVTMWHVFGQGQTELWGAKATLTDPAADFEYESDYAILHSNAVRLNIAKLGGPVTDCTTSVNPGGGTWMIDPNNPSRYYWNTSVLTLYDAPYTAELNIGGRYVYGYNWQLRRDVVPPTIGKTGWWRLTFYTATPASPTPIISFPAGAATVTSAPLVTPPTEVTFTPVVSADPALSYIDICVRGSKGGGGTKGGRK
jgi:hypothetical protein